MIGGSKGIGIGLDFGIGNQSRPKRTEKPYIEPDVLASLCGVWIADQNTNESSTRNIIKNKLKDRGGDFEILNAAYKGNSGYGKYEYDYANSADFWINKESAIATSNKIIVTTTTSSDNSYIIFNTIENNAYKGKIKVIGLNPLISNNEVNSLEIRNNTDVISIVKDGIYNIVFSSEEKTYFKLISNIAKVTLSNKLIIEQIPEHKGAFVTDGVDDLIVSQKKIGDFLDINGDFTVISMIHLLKNEDTKYDNWANCMYSHDYSIINTITKSAIDKTGIFGYYKKGGKGHNINYILGDKEDYSLAEFSSTNLTKNFSVVGDINEYLESRTVSSVAWYWTFIANRELTEDQINQVIEYFNLDKYVAPNIYYNVKKQGITNENHAQFGDKLIDYSGNGHDMQLYNIVWNAESGIGGYREDFTTWYTSDRVPTVELTPTKLVLDRRANAWNFGNMGAISIKAMTIKVNGLSSKNYIDYNYFAEPTSNNRLSIRINKDGIYNLPYGSYSNSSSLIIGFSITILSDDKVTIEQLPSYEGALVLDGVNDYGKVTNLPILKDYTVIADREIVSNNAAVFSKDNPNGAFIYDYNNEVYSFGAKNEINIYHSREITYQSKYVHNGSSITAGNGKDSDSMWLGTIRDGGSRFSSLALYSAMLFPYSLSTFLIDRQLKKHKSSDLYKDMILLRPIIRSNKIDYIENITYINSDIPANIGQWYDKDIRLKIIVNLHSSIDEIAKITLNGTEGVLYQGTGEGMGIYEFPGANLKSPQIIDITIDECIRFEDIVQPYPLLIEFENKTWGNKLKVGEYYTFHAYDIFKQASQKDIYNFGKLYFNGVEKEWHYDGVVISKSNVFTCEYEYVLDSNEPKCILSPELLKIPNKSYQYLGYIPDISGHGNHGYIYNSAYNETSGMNADGSFKLDGVNDFIKLDTLSTGGQQVFIKTLWSSTPTLLYDQRYQGNSGFAIITLAKDTPNNDVIAYKARNINGSSYVDGVLNKHIETYTLQDVVHNITITNNKDTNSQNPIIGKSSYNNSGYTKMSLYTFMLFDGISSPEKIKELNEIMGVNPIVETPPYYYDTYGKTNGSSDRDTLINMGNGGSHDLKLLNFGFNGEDGYCDVTFEDHSWNVVTANRDYYDNKVIINNVEPIYDHSINQYNNCIWGKWLTQYNNPRPSEDVSSFYTRFKGIPQGGSVAYLYVKEDGTIDKKIMNENDVYYLLPASYNTRYKKEPDAMQDAKMGFFAINPWESSLPLTIEIYKGLITDGVDSTLRNTTIPALTDFTCIVKREAIGEQASGSVFMFKGTNANLTGNAFLYDNKKESINRIFSFSQENTLPTNSPISYLTKKECDGQNINSGNGVDTVGLTIGRWDTYWKGAFYKLMLYPKTLDSLQINMLKNLFELDEKIDINNPIFKK